MSDYKESSSGPSTPSLSNRSKPIKKASKYISNPEQDKKFEELKRKYANAIAYLLVKNVKQSELRQFFTCEEENKRRYETIKKFRQAIIEARPKAKQWVDKPFYIGLKISSIESSDEPTVNIMLGDCVFKQPTTVIGSRFELEGYMDTISKIIESEKIWSDPDMADFDIGERDDVSQKYVKKKPQLQTTPTDQLNLNSQEL